MRTNVEVAGEHTRNPHVPLDTSMRRRYLESFPTSCPPLCRLFLVLILTGLFMSSSAAVAAEHPFKEIFGSAAQPTIANPAGVAVDPATGDLLLIDYQLQTVNRFQADGEPAPFTALSGNVIDGHPGEADATLQGEILSSEGRGGGGEFEMQVAVAPPGAAGGTEGDIYVTDAANGVVDVFASSGAYLGQQAIGTLPCGVAVAPGGDVYVGDLLGSEVHKLIPSAPATFTNPANFSTPAPCQIAAGAGPSAGYVFAAEFAGYVYKIDSEGDEEGTTEYVVGAGEAVAVDPGSGHVYLGSGEINEFDASSTTAPEGPLSTIALASIIRGMAVDGGGDIDVTRSGSQQVEVFGPNPTQLAAFTGEATAIGAETATVAGEVNPVGAQVTGCAFEYGLTDAYGRTAPCAENPSQIGAGETRVSVHAVITGLQPGSIYHYRLIATNPTVTATGKDRSFPTYSAPTAGLPDGRAYEQATPVDKNGSNPAGKVNVVVAAVGGDAISYASKGAIPGLEGAQQYPQYVSRRTSAGWVTRGALPPASNGSSAAVKGFSEDLGQIYVGQAPAPRQAGGFYQLDGAAAGLRPIVAGGIKEPVNSQNRYAGASADGSTVLLELIDAQPTVGAAEEAQNTYVWDEATGGLSLAGVLNEGEAPAEGTSPGSYELPRNFPQTSAVYERAISADGSRVFFTAIGSHQVYLRQNPSQPQSPMAGEECTVAADACTFRVSSPAPGVMPLDPDKPATFWFATSNGSQAFFTSSNALTSDATTGPGEEGTDLYRYDAGGQLTDLTGDASDPNGAEVQGVVGVSRDGSYVYFVANGVLANNEGADHTHATPGTCEPPAGELLEETTGACNLYVWHDGHIAFIAPQNATGGQGLTVPLNDAGNWVRKYIFGHEEKTARISADGSILLFRSQDQLTPYKHAGFSEFYRYSAGTGSFACVTCNPIGLTPQATPSLQSIELPNFNGPQPASIETRNLSAGGGRVFFETTEKLVAGDVNGARDVYEWEAPGEGSCTQASPAYSGQDGGCLFLISTGTSPEPSYFADASTTGDDVFFFTGQSLVGQDRDQLVDVYDARVGGGIAAQSGVRASRCEDESSCKSAPAPAATPAPPGSSSFVGPGNPKPHHRHHHRRHRHKKKHRHHRHHRRHARDHQHHHKPGAKRMEGGGER